MSIPLERLSRCFQGLSPSSIATCSRDGEPNVTLLSHVYYVDEKHVALSCQFFNKTRRNVGENPWAIVELNDPSTLDTYRLKVRYLRSEMAGPLFDAMSLRIQAIASVTGMEGIFRLISADIYEVVRVEQVHAMLAPEQAPDLPGPPQPDYAQLRGVQVLSQQINRAADLDGLLPGVLQGLDELFGFRHSMVLVPDDSGERLVTLASHGYGKEGVGSEIGIGEGFVGAVAEQRRPLRVSGVGAELRYGRAIREQVRTSGGPLGPELKLPGLADAQSHLALPLLMQDRLVGVLAVESRDPLAFNDWDETLLDILANQIATHLDRLSTREEEPAAAPAPEAAAPPPSPAPASRPRTFTFFRCDDCVFVDGEYLIRNVPGLILWKLLNAYQKEGRAEFSNRELRMDKGLKLPEVRDNLESRLILLRKRLDQQCPDVRIVPVRRGRFALEVRAPLKLEERESA